MADIYRLIYEMVHGDELYRYCDIDPRYCTGARQIVPNSQVPDKHWRLVTRETEDPWDQFKMLREWAAADKEFVRNVRLQRRIDTPRWEDVS